MNSYELKLTVESLQNYMKIRSLDDYSKKCIERVIRDMEEDHKTMLEHQIYDLKDL